MCQVKALPDLKRHATNIILLIPKETFYLMLLEMCHINLIALRTAVTPYSFARSECNRANPLSFAAIFTKGKTSVVTSSLFPWMM